MMKRPYMEYMAHPLWAVIDKAIDDLVKNDDLIEQTTREIIVGTFACRLYAMKTG